MTIRGVQPFMPKKGKKGQDPLPVRGESEKSTGYKHVELTARNQNKDQFKPKGSKR